MSLAERIAGMIEPALADMGYALVRVQLVGRQRPRLQVMIERVDGEGIRVDDCAGASRAISALLDVEDPIPEAYTLEVSSPGIDRPLVRPADFERFKGHVARIEISTLVEGRRRFQGRLIGLDGDVVRIEAEGQTYDLPIADISRAKLVLTDELLDAARAQQG